MNKLVLLFGAIVLGSLLLGAGYFATRKSSVETTPSPQAEQQTQVESNTFNGTFLDLMETSRDMMCTFDNTDDSGVRTEGTVYIASGGDKINTSFSVHQPSGSFDGNIVRDGDFTYIWTTLQEQGVKIETTPENESLFDNLNNENNPGLSDETKVDFNCVDWTVDESMFTAPSNIEFVDVTEAFEQFQDMPQANQCAACSQLPEGDVRDQCLSVLKCE